MKTSERITVSVPADIAAQLRGLVDAGAIESVSAYVAETVARRIRRDQDTERQTTALDKRGITITPEAQTWADQIFADAKAKQGKPA